MQKVVVKVPAGSYAARIEAGLLRHAGKLLRKEFPGHTRLFIVTVAPVRRRWGKILWSSLKMAGFAAEFLEMPDGEAHKKLSSVENLAVQLSQARADRKSVIVAFGGGVVGDCAGLLASLYMRGVDFVQIPTTLLAQLDAAIGGKTGVNLRTGKNLVGTFHHPRIVLIDLEVLSTLPRREFQAGLYEALKCGVIRDARLFQEIEKSSVAKLCRTPVLVQDIVTRSVKLKAQVVSSDEREGGLRKILNFGHTIGHALEAESKYERFLHGEAVALGMVAATRIAAAMNRIDMLSASRIVSTVIGMGPLPKVTASSSAILRLLQADKKASNGVVHFVLPRRIGQVEIVSDVPEDLILAAVDDLRALSQK